MPSVRGRISERSLGDADAFVGGIIHTVVSLKPRLAIDEIETLAGTKPKISDDEVNAVGFATNHGVQGPRPELRVRRELELGLQKSNQLRRPKRRCSSSSYLHHQW